MAATIRALRPEDAPAVSGLLHAALPQFILPPELLLWKEDRTPAAAQRRSFVAASGDAVAGFAAASLDWATSEPGEGEIQVVVPPEFRGQGAGSALLQAAERHLREVGARRFRTWMDDDGSPEWAERRGYTRTRVSLHPRLDLADLPEVPPLPAGVELRTFRDYAEDPRPVYEVDCAVSLDEPTDVPMNAISYPDWHRMWWGRPAHDLDLSIVIVADGEPAALAYAETDGATRYRSGITGVLPQHRGRGLAKLAKAVSLHRARERGLRYAFTGNDTTNGPMRAVNNWLGYQPFATEIELLREAG